ncbi:MAG: molybdate ABC transporter substrate-binding protein [Candidatus Brocadiia bacterium]
MRVILAGCAVLLGLVMCGLGYRAATDSEAPRALQVFCGAGLMHPMEEMRQQFEADSGAPVRASYGGSGVLMGRLGSGRPCDVFIPGAARVVDDAARRGWVEPGTRLDLVLHVPVIAVSRSVAEAVGGLEDLGRPGLRVGLGAPRACAIGEAAERILEQNGLREKVRPNVCVRASTVNQLLLYLATEHIDAAIIWEDMLHLPEAAGKVHSVRIPPSRNSVSTIAAARGSRAESPQQAAAFIRFLASASARQVWKRWGFTPCDE